MKPAGQAFAVSGTWFVSLSDGLAWLPWRWGVSVWPRHAGSTRSPKPRLAIRCAATPRPVRRRPFVAPRQIRPCRISHLESVFGVAAGSYASGRPVQDQ